MITLKSRCGRFSIREEVRHVRLLAILVDPSRFWLAVALDPIDLDEVGRGLVLYGSRRPQLKPADTPQSWLRVTELDVKRIGLDKMSN